MKKIQLGATLYPYGFTQPNPLPVGEDELALKGRHNVLNSMAATIAANVVGIQKEVIRESLMRFEGVAHRLQYVATVKGVRYINDSKATNVNSCWYALESMTTPTVLILGGKDKGNDYSEIDELVREKCHTLIFMGLHNEKLHAHFDGFGLRIIDTNNLHDAVQGAYNAAHEGDTVLLSPCCASFDLFKSYEDRGDQFMAAVRNL
jgi:UDP-N-acetylmuramoylalanine--D-glutamate ligase